MHSEDILKIATQQFLRHGLRNVSMDDISRMCGVSKKTLYKYFGDKENLIRKALVEFLEKQKVISDMATIESRNAIEAHCRMVQQLSIQMREFNSHVTFELRKYYPQLWELIEDFHKNHVRDFIRINLERGIREGLYDANVDRELTPAFYIALIRGVLLFDTEVVENFSFPKVYHYLIYYHLMAITTEAGKRELQDQFSQGIL